MEKDNLYMSRALELAKLGAGNVSTNPMVGAVVVCDNKIIGEGYHRKYGCPHAEVNAVASVKEESLFSRSTMYVTLEPCSHFGKTPPCCDLLIRKGFKRVVVAMQDPFALVAGEGIRRMREAGLTVDVGVMEKEALFLNRRFVTFNTLKRPYVIIKYARTTDGFIDNDRESSTPATWLTGYPAKALVHRWRAEEDAIMVGTNTVLRDNPELTVREWTGKNPLRVTMDKRDRIPSTAKIINGEADTVVFTHHSLSQIFDDLYKRGVQSIMVEGGRALINNIVTLGLYDEVREFVSPLRLSDLKGGRGGDGIRAPQIHNLKLLSSREVGKDVKLNIFIK
ncbi:MAG: bifunctional diaminohydroxyphosphoribosylaminopyrimidine deaminase/5-amino-6-(5-phosphoribosylamino)uracil reductase RibD [Bacteroidetes bacterium]|nr:bifunctional diaminohydroxyphosphoribosylaminopyrimidine deaminase/5-amino-6-(5-phosphoribosylamino)uracil reductase RibD [Bacteroidota bacterium]